MGRETATRGERTTLMPVGEEKNVVKVSDWSQKYKLGMYALSGIGITYFGYKTYGVLTEIKVILERILVVLERS